MNVAPSTIFHSLQPPPPSMVEHPTNGIRFRSTADVGLKGGDTSGLYLAERLCRWILAQVDTRRTHCSWLMSIRACTPYVLLSACFNQHKPWEAKPAPREFIKRLNRESC